MTRHYYSPNTQEIIPNATPADWMGSTTVVPPTYDPVTQGCFWRGSAWEVVTPAPDIDKIKAELTAAVQAHLDTAARARGYDDIRSAATYADEPVVPQFQADGLALRAWRSLAWQRCYVLLAEVEEGVRPIPTAAALIAELPILVLP